MNHELLQELKFEQEVNQTAGEILHSSSLFSRFGLNRKIFRRYFIERELYQS
jgi:hypothetical protein